MVKVGIITQARTTSTRLPRKVLKLVGDKTLLEHHTNRLMKSNLPIIVATTLNQTDDVIADFCAKKNLDCFRGDELNVLSRYFLAAQLHKLDVIVRVTSDCPLIDGELIAHAVETYLADGRDWLYLSNCLERTYPRGFDFEIFSFIMLKEAFEKANGQFETEHVTPYFYQNAHKKTQFISVKKSENYSDIRLTVDEQDDFRLIEKLILDYSADQLNEDRICKLLRSHPELIKINQNVEQKKV